MTSAALAPEAAIVPLTLTLFEAVSVKLLLALQETLSLTLMLPLPAARPLLLCSVTEVVPSSVESVAPVISPPVGATVKSCGSISQVPMRPRAAAVVTFASLATSTLAPLVSIKPPLPPPRALASIMPPTFTVPAVMPPKSSMVPLWLATVRASITPELLTTLASRVCCAPAVIMTKPPSASIS